MRITRLDIFLLISALLSILTALLCSADVLMEGKLPRLPAYNDIVSSLAAGYFTSVIVYFLVVRIPEERRRRRIRRMLLSRYQELKSDLIGLLIHASGKAYSDEPESFQDPKKFREYFEFDETGSGGRWYEVLNGLNDYYIGEINNHLQIFSGELHFALGQIDVQRDDVFDYLKRFSTSISTMKTRKTDYDDIKIWGRYLWSILGSSDFVSGRSDTDRIEELINRI